MTISMQMPGSRAKRLEERFETIWHERMLDVSVINDRLKVQAVDFRSWDDHVLGVLVTPWFMNLMLLPGENDDWGGLGIGAKRSFKFEADSFDFIVGEEPGLGKFMSCSMFSPMFNFENHEAAVATAEAIMEGLFDQDNKELLQPQMLDDEKLNINKETNISEDMLEGVWVVSEVVRQNLDRFISRRDLLRGCFLQAQNNDKDRNEKC